MKSKKSRFWSFCLSFLPGCAEMYMGFMKMGLSLMAAFWGIIGTAVFLNIGALLFLAVIVWFYSFFHARNLVHMPEGDFLNLEDAYLYHLSGMRDAYHRQEYRRIMAVILILFGGILCLRSLKGMVQAILPSFLWEFFWMFDNYMPQLIVGLGIIILGIRIIKGKERELLEGQEGGTDDEE